jgi:hypothetical protein
MLVGQQTYQTWLESSEEECTYDVVGDVVRRRGCIMTNDETHGCGLLCERMEVALLASWFCGVVRMVLGN